MWVNQHNNRSLQIFIVKKKKKKSPCLAKYNLLTDSYLRRIAWHYVIFVKKFLKKNFSSSVCACVACSGCVYIYAYRKVKESVWKVH